MDKPVVKAVTPSYGDPEDRFTATITGDIFEGVTVVSFGPQIDVLNFNVVAGGIITAKISIRRDANPGPRDVALTGPGGTGALGLGFTVR